MCDQNESCFNLNCNHKVIFGTNKKQDGRAVRSVPSQSEVYSFVVTFIDDTPVKNDKGIDIDFIVISH